MNGRNKTAVIIGAGAAGLFAARALKKEGIEPVLLEKEAHVGGKCHTYSDPDNPKVKTEWGAVLVAPNYGVVLDAVNEKGIVLEESLDMMQSSVPFAQKINDMSWYERYMFSVSLMAQTVKYTYAVLLYQHARNNFAELPEDYELSFSAFAEKYGMQDICELLKYFVAGFGYGAMEDIPAYCVMEYTGAGSIPGLIFEHLFSRSSLISVKGGTQHLMERIAEDFNVITSATVTNIDRSAECVSVTYTDSNGNRQNITADSLILATSPLQWQHLGMKLTTVEKDCINNLTYYRYPVAVCKLQGLPALNQCIPATLEKEGFGHLALITTRDNRSHHNDGRLCTAYINLPAGTNTFNLDKNGNGYHQLIDELGKIDGVSNVEVIATKVWQDYMPTLPWKYRLQLNDEQMHADTRTLYVGAYPAGGFEDIRCVADQATRAVNHHILHKQEENYLSYAVSEISRAFNFFAKIPRDKAEVDDPAVPYTPDYSF